MKRRRSMHVLFATLSFSVLSCGLALADGDTPKFPKPKMTVPSPDKPGVKSDDVIYSLGYWQAKSGEYSAALATLHSAANQADPRIRTMIGFSLRKLGRVDEAMGYYLAVLDAHPERTTTRQYLGEAYLQIGQPDMAKQQLSEIAKRCGTACEDYQNLAEAIAKSQKPAS